MQKTIAGRETVLFLGAGFSYNSGLPIMSEFGAESEEDYKRLKDHALAEKTSGKYRYAAPMLIEAADTYYAFRNLCGKSCTLTLKDINNIETVFCIAEAMAESGQKKIKGFAYDIGLDELIQKIQMWTWKIYQQFIFHNPERMNLNPDINIDVYNNIFSVIKENELSDAITVITTNYDIVYEYLSWKHGMPCIYPIRNSEPISVGNGKERYALTGRDNLASNTVLCKLHGSINYFVDQKEGANDKLLIADDLGDGETVIGNSGVWNKDKPSITAVDAIWKIKEKYGDSLNPAIIPPSYSKLTHDKWLQEIWKTAFEAISLAKKIIFIGYSMPASDGFMQALIHGAMAVREKTEPPVIYVIDPSENVHNRYMSVFPAVCKKNWIEDLHSASLGTIEEILCEK